MTGIKICGIKYDEDIGIINELKPDYAGMVLFFEKSKRNIAIDRAAEMIKKLDKNIQKTAVVVSPDINQIKAITDVGFDYIQIHGTLSDEVHDVLRIPVIRAVNVAGETAEDKESIRRQLESVLADEKTAGILFDGSSPGAGKTFDWSLLKNIQKTDKLLFLAGGLTPENAAQAVKTVAPDVVDVSSGVEKEVLPGEAFAGKDAEKITKFVENVRL